MAFYERMLSEKTSHNKMLYAETSCNTMLSKKVRHNMMLSEKMSHNKILSAKRLCNTMLYAKVSCNTILSAEDFYNTMLSENSERPRGLQVAVLTARLPSSGPTRDLARGEIWTLLNNKGGEIRRDEALWIGKSPLFSFRGMFKALKTMSVIPFGRVVL